MTFIRLIKSLLQKLVGVKLVGLPIIPAASLEQAKEDDWEYLTVFIAAYQQSVQPEILQNTLTSLSDVQCILVLYNDLYEQVTNGGFLQLIQNGYGRNLFENPFGADIAKWGAIQLADLLARAKAIYKANQEHLERQRSIPEFSQLYSKFHAFEPLEDHFYEIIDSQTAIIRAYVERHLDQFAIIN